MSDKDIGIRVDTWKIERAVLADADRPCLYGVAGPCSHPACLDAHYKTLFDAEKKRLSIGQSN